jgi:hypothetical protein
VRFRALQLFAFAILLVLSLTTAHQNALASSNDCFDQTLHNLFEKDQIPEVYHPTGHPPVKIITDEEWKGSNPITLYGSTEKLSMSYDGEIPWDEYLKFVRTDEEALERLKEITKDFNYTRNKLKYALNMSDKQLDIFVIPKNSELAGKASWNITELPPRFFAFQIERKLPSNELDDLAKSFEKLLKKRGFSSQGFPDMGFIEIAHSTFDTSPAQYISTMNRLKKEFPKASFHLHLGIPNNLVSEAETMAVARAVESKIILQLAESNFNKELSYSDFTSLHKDNLIADESVHRYRGVIRMGLYEFTRAHNIEIRQYSSLAEGLDLVRFGANLSKNHQALYQVKKFAPKLAQDKQTISLHGALEYMGHLFRNKGTREHVELGNEMIKLSREVLTPERAVIPEMRSKVQKFLIKNKILEKMDDPSLYLKIE